MTGLDRAAARINGLLTAFTLLLLVVLCGVTVMQVVSRYVFNSPLSWTEEVLRYLLVWITFLGFGLAVHKKSEMSVSFLTFLLPPRLRKAIEILMILIIIAFLLVFVREGFAFAFESLGIMTIALQIPFTWINISAPVGGVFLIALYVLRLIRTAGSLGNPSLPESGENACPPEEDPS